MHYGSLTSRANSVDVLHAMLWLIHHGRSGQCTPSLSTIADKAPLRSRSTPPTPYTALYYRRRDRGSRASAAC
jgi:hypothetical protein